MLHVRRRNCGWYSDLILPTSSSFHVWKQLIDNNSVCHTIYHVSAQINWNKHLHMLWSMSQCFYWHNSSLWKLVGWCRLSGKPAGIHLWSCWNTGHRRLLQSPRVKGHCSSTDLDTKNSCCKWWRVFGRLGAGVLEKQRREGTEG